METEVAQAIGLAGMTNSRGGTRVETAAFGEAGDRLKEAPDLAIGGLFKAIGKEGLGRPSTSSPASLVSKEETHGPASITPDAEGAGLLNREQAAKAISGEQICRLLPARTRTGTHTAASDTRTLIARRDTARISILHFTGSANAVQLSVPRPKVLPAVKANLNAWGVFRGFFAGLVSPMLDPKLVPNGTQANA